MCFGTAISNRVHMPCRWATAGYLTPLETRAYSRTDHPTPTDSFQHRISVKFRVPQETLWPHCEEWRMSHFQFSDFCIEHQPFSFLFPYETIVVVTIILGPCGDHCYTCGVVDSSYILIHYFSGVGLCC